jgi:exonuclease VII large subunit
MGILRRGGASARGWFSTLLQRLPKAERDAFKALWERVDLRETQSLTKTEQRELSELAKRLEKLVDAPLSRDDKKRLRSVAREDFFKSHPELAKRLVNRDGKAYPVHHRRPLEYAELFPGEDINALMNLRAVDETVHASINTVWTAFRSVRGKFKAEDVDEVVAIVDRHFDRWYNVTYEKSSVSALADAEAAALAEVQRLVSRLSGTR